MVDVVDVGWYDDHDGIVRVLNLKRSSAAKSKLPRPNAASALHEAERILCGIQSVVASHGSNYPVTPLKEPWVARECHNAGLSVEEDRRNKFRKRYNRH